LRSQVALLENLLGHLKSASAAVITMAKKGGIDLDSILDQALDDFDEIESAESAKKASARASAQNTKKKDPLAGEKATNSKEKPTTTKVCSYHDFYGIFFNALRGTSHSLF
jgi:hypothetical protein